MKGFRKLKTHPKIVAENHSSDNKMATTKVEREERRGGKWEAGIREGEQRVSWGRHAAVVRTRSCSSSVTLPGHGTDLQKSDADRPRQRGRLAGAPADECRHSRRQSELETPLFLCTSRSQRWVDGSNSIKRFLRIYQAPAQRGIDPSPSVELVRAARRHLFLSAQQSFVSAVAHRQSSDLLENMIYLKDLLKSIKEIHHLFFFFFIIQGLKKCST